MDRYYTFNADKFLKDSSGWAAEKKKLMKDLESITELKAIKNSEVHSGNISDPTAETAQKEMEIRHEIERIDRYEELCKYAFDRLTKQEKDIITAWYYSRKRINYIVDTLSYTYGCKPRKVYKMRREALQSFSRLVGEGELLW